jgi:predicted signal transduction protein with EAL and GGDEF domain
LGVAVFPDHGDTGLQLIQSADAALYRAKHTGRDRVMAAEFAGETTLVNLAIQPPSHLEVS